ncbi:MAG: recombinase family protein [Clostridia bacterium]|nr:recombinase family protein [Clostridia bacterium]
MKVAIYCRLSEEDKNKERERDSESIANQKQMLRDYAKGQGWEIYRIYSDDDYTGADRTRPEFNRLIQDARDGLFQIVLCKSQSRFTREMELVERYIHYLFPLWGIRFIGVVDGADTESKGNKKSRQINGLVNEWYLEDMSESIKSVLDSKRRNGYHIGSFALYGYKKDEVQRGKLKIDKEASEVVKRIFSLYISGCGKSKIARILNEQSVPNPTEYKRQKGLMYKPAKGKSGTLWRYSTISSILNNQMYIGNMVQGKYGSVSYKSKENRPKPRDKWFIVEGTHEPIIDKDTWNRAQELLRGKARVEKTGELGVFSKKVYCAGCGYTLKSSRSGGKNYLKCPTHYISREMCGGSFISVERLERVVLSELNKIFDKYLDKEAVELLRLEKPKEHLEITEEKIKKNEKMIKEIYKDKLNGRIDESVLFDVLEEIEKEQKTLRRVYKMQKLEQNEQSNIDLLEEYISPKHLKRAYLDLMVEKIVVGKRIKGTKNVPITIYWRF